MTNNSKQARRRPNFTLPAEVVHAIDAMRLEASREMGVLMPRGRFLAAVIRGLERCAVDLRGADSEERIIARIADRYELLKMREPAAKTVEGK